MPISFRRYKHKATKFINDNYSNEMNHDLKMYLDMPEFRPFFDQSVERINAGRDEDNEIKSTIRHLAQSTIDTAFEVAEERRGGGGASSSARSSPSSSASSSDNELLHSTTDELQPQDVNLFKGNGIHHHYHYFFH